LNIKAS